MPALTFPFVLTTWILMLAAYQFFRVAVGSLPAPALPAALGPDAARFGIDAGALVTAMLKGVSQVFLIGNWVSGLLILVGARGQLAVGRGPRGGRGRREHAGRDRRSAPTRPRSARACGATARC